MAVLNVYRHKNSKFWQIEFVVNGVTYRRSSKEIDKEKALDRASEWREEVLAKGGGRRPFLEMPDCTFGEAADRYWEEHGQHTRSADALDSDLECIVLWVGADKMCSTINRSDERRIRARMRAGEPPPGKSHRGRPLRTEGQYAPKSINDTIDLIGRILTYTEESLGTGFPYRRPNSISSRGSDREIVRARHRHMSFEEQWRVEKVMDRDLTDMVHFAIETGMRSDALCSLRWPQIDWTLCTVTFLLKAEGRRSEELPHTVDLTVEAMEILYRRRAMHHHERVGSDHVFMLRAVNDHWHKKKKRLRGELIPVGSTLFLQRFKKACKAVGIVNLTVHDLRRTAGRRIYDEEGSDIEAARALLGHTDIKQTQNYLGVTGTSINSHLRRRSARAKLAKAELDAAANQTDAAPGSRAYALRLALGEASDQVQLPLATTEADPPGSPKRNRPPATPARRLSSRT